MNLSPDTYARQIEILNSEMELLNQKRYWAVVLGLKPQRDGDQFCFVWGEDLQSGIAGFGPTAMAALIAFDEAMYRRAPAHTEGQS